MIYGSRILITGGGGFFGTALAEALAPSNQIRLYDVDFDTNAFSYSDLSSDPNIECVRGDIVDDRRLEKLCSDVDIVIHLAAVVGVHQVLMDTRRTLEVNIQGTHRLLTALPTKRIERFVYLSSSEVYGTHAYRVTEDQDTQIGPAEDPRWCYATSKVASEHLVQATGRERGLPTVIIRPFNIFGPRRVGDHAILRFMFQALNQEPLTVHDDGSAIRAWCFVTDFVDGVLRMLSNKDAVGQTFNLGNPVNTVTLFQLASDIIDVCGSHAGVAFTPIKHSDVHLRVPDISRARTVLGFEPQVALHEALVAAREWYAAHAPRIAPTFLTR